MDIMMFIIFLVTDLFLIFCFQFAFSSGYRYQNGMYLGVHIPADHKDDPDVSDLITSSRQSMKHFQIINTLISIAICFINFASIAIFAMVYYVWIFEYCFFIIMLNNSCHKKMYALKMQNGWIIESQQKKIYIDTRISADAGSSPLSFKWHIVIIIAEIAAFVPYIADGAPRYRAYMFTFFICSLIVSAIALPFHIFINRVAWIYMALSTYISGNYLDTSFFVYIFVQFLNVFGIFIPLFLAQQRKKELLASDTAPIYVDDDEYWKSGFYYNPNDTHLFVENRIQPGNYTLNYAKKGAWVFSGATAALIIGCLIFVFAVLFPLINLKEEITLADNGILTISAGGYKNEISVDDITEIKLLDELPDDSFLRTNGASTDSYDIGRYEGRTLGKCSLYVFDGYSPILMIKTDDTLVFVNSKENGEIERLYEELNQ